MSEKMRVVYYALWIAIPSPDGNRHDHAQARLHRSSSFSSATF